MSHVFGNTSGEIGWPVIRSPREGLRSAKKWLRRPDAIKQECLRQTEIAIATASVPDASRGERAAVPNFPENYHCNWRADAV